MHRDSIALWTSQCRTLLAKVKCALLADRSTPADATNAIVALLRLPARVLTKPKRGGRHRLSHEGTG